MNSIKNISLLFIVVTIIGTLTHELGHYAAGVANGLNCKIRYASCYCISPAEELRLDFSRNVITKYRTKDSIPTELLEEYRTQLNFMTP